jgi:hypothetical protein
MADHTDNAFRSDEQRFHLLLSRLDGVEGRLQDISSTLHVLMRVVAALHKQGDALMAVSQEMATALASIDTATTAVGDRIAALALQITTDMSQAEVSSIVTQLNSDAAKLTSIAADPNNPVPPSAAA